MGGTLPVVFNAGCFVSILVYCYIAIYSHFQKIQQSAKDKIMSTITSGLDSTRDTVKHIDVSILITTFTLAGWTLIGNEVYIK